MLIFGHCSFHRYETTVGEFVAKDAKIFNLSTLEVLANFNVLSIHVIGFFNAFKQRKSR